MISRKRIRFPADVAKPTSYRLRDLSTGESPDLWKGNDVQFEIALLFNDVLRTDIGNIASLTLDIRQTNAAGDLILTQTLSSSDLNPALTSEQWEAASSQHALVAFTKAQTNLTAGLYWIGITCVTNDSPSREYTPGVALLTIADDGTGTTETAPTPPQEFYDQPTSDARFQQQHADGASILFKNGRDPYLYCPDDGLWYPLIAKLIDASPALALGPGEPL